MHELSLLENVREILQAHAIEQKFTKVTSVTLEIGKLCCVAPDALRFGFDSVMKDSLAEEATLILSFVEGLGICQQCGKQRVMESLHDACPHCQSPSVKIIQGTKMKVKDLLVI